MRTLIMLKEKTSVIFKNLSMKPSGTKALGYILLSYLYSLNFFAFWLFTPLNYCFISAHVCRFYLVLCIKLIAAVDVWATVSAELCASLLVFASLRAFCI